MKKKTKFLCVLVVLGALLFSGCTADSPSPSITEDDGVVRNEAGDPILNYDNESILVQQNHENQINLGYSFSASHSQEILAGENYTYVFDTGNDGHAPHIEKRVINILNPSAQDITLFIDVYENCTVNDNGDNVTIFNNKRESSILSDINLYNGSNVSLNNAINIEPLGSRVTLSKRSETFNIQPEKYIQSPNEKYCIVMDNQGSGDIELISTWRWHE